SSQHTDDHILPSVLRGQLARAQFGVGCPEDQSSQRSAPKCLECGQRTGFAPELSSNNVIQVHHPTAGWTPRPAVYWQASKLRSSEAAARPCIGGQRTLSTVRDNSHRGITKRNPG